MPRNAVILGGGQCKWGVREAHLVDLFQEAGKACLDDIPGLKPLDIDGIIVATSYAGRCSFQVNTAPVVAERLGLKPTSICTRCDTLCAGGSTGIILAKGLVESGNADIVMVTGGEKLYTPQKWEIFYSELASVDHDWEATHGMGLPPPFFSLTAQEHMIHYGTKKGRPCGGFRRQLQLCRGQSGCADAEEFDHGGGNERPCGRPAPDSVRLLSHYRWGCGLHNHYRRDRTEVYEQALGLPERLRTGVALQPFRQLPRRASGGLETCAGSGGEGLQ